VKSSYRNVAQGHFLSDRSRDCASGEVLPYPWAGLKGTRNDFNAGLSLAGEKHWVQTESKRGQFERRALHVSDAVSTLECNATGLCNFVTAGILASASNNA